MLIWLFALILICLIRVNSGYIIEIEATTNGYCLQRVITTRATVDIRCAAPGAALQSALMMNYNDTGIQSCYIYADQEASNSCYRKKTKFLSVNTHPHNTTTSLLSSFIMPTPTISPSHGTVCRFSSQIIIFLGCSWSSLASCAVANEYPVLYEYILSKKNSDQQMFANALSFNVSAFQQYMHLHVKCHGNKTKAKNGISYDNATFVIKASISNINSDANVSLHILLIRYSEMSEKRWKWLKQYFLVTFVQTSGQLTQINNVLSDGDDIVRFEHTIFLWLVVIMIFMCIWCIWCERQYRNAFVVDKALILIIGISQFKDEKLFLHGIQQNVKQLRDLWRDLYDYDVFVCNEESLHCTKTDVIEFIDHYKTRLEDLNYKAVIIHIISHGVEDRQTDLQSLSIDFIQHELTTTAEHEQFIKLIFHHGCRGETDYHDNGDHKKKEHNHQKKDDHNYHKNEDSQDSNCMIICGNILGRAMSDTGHFTDCICDSFGGNVKRVIKQDFNSLLTEIGRNLEEKTQNAEDCTFNGTLRYNSIRFEKCYKTPSETKTPTSLNNCELIEEIAEMEHDYKRYVAIHDIKNWIENDVGFLKDDIDKYCNIFRNNEYDTLNEIEIDECTSPSATIGTIDDYENF